MPLSSAPSSYRKVDSDWEQPSTKGDGNWGGDALRTMEMPHSWVSKCILIDYLVGGFLWLTMVNSA